MGIASELFQSRMQVLDKYRPSAVFLYICSSCADEADAIATVQAVAPSGYNYGFLRQIEVVERLTDDTWKMAAKYDLQPEDWSPAEIGFDSTGGTAHITTDIATSGSFAASGLTPANMQGVIGYDGEKVNGVDIISPVWKREEVHYFTDDEINEAAYYAATGKVNADYFRGYDPGELLLEGVVGRKRSPQAPYALTFKFAASPNQTGLTIGGISGINKKGWEVLDILYNDVVDGGSRSRIKVPIQVTVHQVYDTINFSTLGI